MKSLRASTHPSYLNIDTGISLKSRPRRAGNSMVPCCVLAVIGIALASGKQAFAQWSADPSVNLPLADASGEQNQSKIRLTSDGGAYVSWFDNRTAGYDVYLQRIDKDGVEQWAHNGVLIADRGYSSTVDYGLAVDANDNAIITYRDDRQGPSQIGANLVAPDGTLLWGAGGVVLASSTDGFQPKCAALSDGTYAISWLSGSPSFVTTQRLDASGAPLWTSPGVTLTEASRALNVSDIAAGDNGSVIVLWVRCGGTNCILSNKYLYAQKIGNDGTLLWNSGSPVIVFDATSIQNGYYPVLEADGSGGALVAWYETGGSRNAYVQHLDAGGNPLFPTGGAAVNTTASVYRISAWESYDPATGETVAAWTQTNTLQSMWGLYAQKFDATGNRLWGEAGVELLALNSNQNSFARVNAFEGGAIVSAFDARSATTGVLATGRLDADGLPVWPGTLIEACSVDSGKARLDVAHNGCDLLLTWGDSRNDFRDIYIQNVMADGALGLTIPLPGDMNCSGAAEMGDVEPFVTALLNPADYLTQYPCCNLIAADANADTLIDGADVGPFVEILLGM